MGGTIRQPHPLQRRSVCDDRGCRGQRLRDRNHGHATGANDWTTIKYNSAGVQEWLRTLDGGGNDAAFAITTDEAGNVYVTGSSAGGFYFMTAKYSAAGDQLWVQFFTTIGEGDAGVDIAVDHDGNVYVTGYNVGRPASISSRSSTARAAPNSGCGDTIREMERTCPRRSPATLPAST